MVTKPWDRREKTTEQLQVEAASELSKIPGVISTKTSKPISVLSANSIASLATLVPTIQIGPTDSAFRWTGHSPAPPGDLVTSLQRLQI